MKNLIAFTAFAAFLFSGSAIAGPTTELKVAGVVKPPACQPTFAGDGVVDFGTIPAASLTPGQYKKLPHRTIPFAISCDAPLKVALKISDNRASSAVPAAAGTNTNFTYGLGMVAGKKVGGYSLGISAHTVTADGAAVRLLYSVDGNQTWASSVGSGQIGKDRTLAWTALNGRAPSAFKSIVGAVWVWVGLEKPENLPLAQDVPLDGSATLEVLYL